MIYSAHLSRISHMAPYGAAWCGGLVQNKRFLTPFAPGHFPLAQKPG
ncbi:hypothetical protein EJP617_24740 [Erwinia sp. Ejp617]|nr:hypothetical protein EJP617_24740 [Erwinia sp. Ejp617]